MNNKKGFVFIETILTIVVLTTTLVVLYTSYSRSVISEKRRLYYDDISYVYKTMAIRDAFDNSINTSKFKFALDNAEGKYYFYMFSAGSDIFSSNSLMIKARDLYNYKVLVYVPFAKIPLLKNCVNTEGNTTDMTCKNTLEKINDFADATFIDYLKNINVDKNKVSSRSKGILISLIYETKDGNDAIDKGGYENCLQREIFSYYSVPSSATNDTKKNYIKKYYADDAVNFDMKCENAYYNSWVYL